jgi:hypothetical protein
MKIQKNEFLGRVFLVFHWNFGRDKIVFRKKENKNKLLVLILSFLMVLA